MKRPLNICLINTYDIVGGAARAAYRLHKGLTSRNNNSVMIVRKKKSQDTNMLALDIISDEDKAEEEIFSAIQKQLINQNRTDISDTLFSLPYPGYDLSNTNLIRSADIINLHWVNYFQSVESIASLLSLHKPVVWTLHDQWAFTGGCHYSAGCGKYSHRCEQCPQLLDNSSRLPELVLKNKLNYFDNSMVIVSPSNWLAECARKSTLFKSCRIEVIPNGLDIDTFKPTAKVRAKRELNINPETTTMLFGAISHTKKRKGFQQLCKAFDFCRKNEKFAELIRTGKVRIITFGTANSPMRQVGIPAVSLGYIDSDEKLALIYSAADFLVLPSLEENLSNIMLECMSCGTPIIAFETGGMPDAIKHGKTGYLTTAFQSDEFGKYILDMTFKPQIRQKMSLAARDLVEKDYSLEVQVDRYLELFDDLCKNRNKLRKNFPLTEHKEFSASLSYVHPLFFTVYRRFSAELLRKKNKELNSVSSSSVVQIVFRIYRFIKRSVGRVNQLIRGEL